VITVHAFPTVKAGNAPRKPRQRVIGAEAVATTLPARRGTSRQKSQLPAGPGSPAPDGPAEEKEQAVAGMSFEHDFSNVRVHADESDPARDHAGPAIAELPAGGEQKEVTGRASTQWYLGEHGSVTERDARSVASQLMRDAARDRADPPGAQSRPNAGSRGQTEAGLHGTLPAPALVRQAIAGSAGRPLDPSIRGYAGPRLGISLDNVRVHTDRLAGESAAAIYAQAYTAGHDIFFGQGSWAPETRPGRALLMHELAHVAQQAAGQPVIYRMSILETVARAFGGGTFSPQELTDYLKFLEMGKIEDHFDSDNKAREVIHRKLYAGKGAGIEALLIREVLAGHVSAADENAIVTLMADLTPAELRSVINYYNDNLDNRTGKGFIEDLIDALSEKNLERANISLNSADLETHAVQHTTRIQSKVADDPNMRWVGLIVRGKWSKEHTPGVMEQHADVVLPGPGGQMQTHGYFGDQANVQGSSAENRASTGIDIPGIAADMAWFLLNRPAYVELDYAMLVDMKSTLILVKVTKEQALQLDQAWEDLKKDPGTFYILGHNCSTAAAAGFEKADIAKEISGLDTPDHLFQQMRQRYHDAFMISGYYGYTRAGRHWEMVAGEPLPVMVSPGTGPWQGPFVVQMRLS
jgi:Domain of unknown function (DUF4157)